MKFTTVRSTQDGAYRMLAGYEPLNWEGEALLSDKTHSKIMDLKSLLGRFASGRALFQLYGLRRAAHTDRPFNDCMVH